MHHILQAQYIVLLIQKTNTDESVQPVNGGFHKHLPVNHLKSGFLDYVSACPEEDITKIFNQTWEFRYSHLLSMIT